MKLNLNERDKMKCATAIALVVFLTIGCFPLLMWDNLSTNLTIGSAFGAGLMLAMKYIFLKWG